MSVPRLMVLAGASPSEQHGGEVYLAEACRHYPADRLSRFSVVHGQYTRPSEWLGVELGYADHPREAGFLRAGRPVAQATALPLHLYNRRFAVPRVVREAVRFGRAQEPDLLWVLLDSLTLITAAPRVARELGVPMVVSVLDPPERWGHDLKLDPYTKRVALRDFERSLRSAVRVATISEGMQEDYRRRFGIASILLRHGIHPALGQPPATAPNAEGELVIGIAGSLYGREAHTALSRALDSVGWRLSGRRVRLRILSSAITLDVPAGHVEFLGWRPLPEAIQLLSECDVLYLPYWFDPRYAYTARMCFPTKLASYFAAGRPVLVHAPSDSAPARFIGEHGGGVACSSLLPSGVLGDLNRLLNDREFYAAATSAGTRAVHGELGLDVFLRRLTHLIGGDEDLRARLLAAADPGIE